MFVSSSLHQIITSRTIDASLMSIILILLATVTSLTLHVIVTRALSVLVALESFRTAWVTVTRFTTFVREAIMVGDTFVTSGSLYTRLTVTLPIETVTRWVITADRVAHTTLATIAWINVVESVFAFVTVASDYVRFAATISCYLVTDWNSLLRLLGAVRVTGAVLTKTVRCRKWITKVTYIREVVNKKILKSTYTNSDESETKEDDSYFGWNKEIIIGMFITE